MGSIRPHYDGTFPDHEWLRWEANCVVMDDDFGDGRFDQLEPETRQGGFVLRDLISANFFVPSSGGCLFLCVGAIKNQHDKHRVAVVVCWCHKKILTRVRRGADCGSHLPAESKRNFSTTPHCHWLTRKILKTLQQNVCRKGHAHGRPEHEEVGD
jgi:hypothetical protein